MEPDTNDPPLIVIVGQTASGKTAMALELARRFKGEIIAADSRTVYRGMDIGTAKPTLQERQEIPHHLIDVVDPNQSFNAERFQHMARQAIHEISLREHIPFLVGGTGLYVDSVIYDFDFQGGDTDLQLRAELERLSVTELQERIVTSGLALPVNERNPRHLIRTIERNGAEPRKHPLRPHTLVLGLSADPEVLKQKISLRVQDMVARGLVEEVERLSSRYGWDVPALQAPAYKAFRSYIEGVNSLEDAERHFIQQDVQYAKRQKTWFRRNNDIRWISNMEDAVDIVTTFLNK